MVSQAASNLSEWFERLPGLEALRRTTAGEPAVTVFVLDGPVAGLTAPLPPQSEAAVHGTMVASIIKGSMDGSVAGIAPGCTLRSIDIYGASDGDDGSAPACSQEALAGFIDEAVRGGANIINISAADPTDPSMASRALHDAVARAVAADVLVVASAGNHGMSGDVIPASLPGVLAVGAHDPTGHPLLFSNWGPRARGQGILAPGLEVPAACPAGGVCRSTGTSYAAAAVTGVAGLLMSAAIASGGEPGGQRIREAILAAAVPCDTSTTSICAPHLSGRLDVAGAAAALRITVRQHDKREEPMNDFEMPSLTTSFSTAAGATPAGPAGADVASVTLADCGCGCGGKGKQASDGGGCGCGGKKTGSSPLAYPIGRIGVSFASQTRRDSIWRSVNGGREGDLKPISNEALVRLFQDQPYQAQSVVWTLSRTDVPMYAIVPHGAFAAETYRWLVQEWADPNVEFASIPGVIAGQGKLYDGSVVDLLVPDLRGMNSWSVSAYTQAIVDERRGLDAAIGEAQLTQEVSRYLSKIMFTIRNRGVTPEDRALNAAATNAFNVSPVITQAGREGMTLRDVRVERSPLNRAGGEYYDVLLTFFDPAKRLEKAPLLARFTIDVADTVPVVIGEPTIWYEY